MCGVYVSVRARARLKQIYTAFNKPLILLAGSRATRSLLFALLSLLIRCAPDEFFSHNGAYQIATVHRQRLLLVIRLENRTEKTREYYNMLTTLFQCK